MRAINTHTIEALIWQQIADQLRRDTEAMRRMGWGNAPAPDPGAAFEAAIATRMAAGASRFEAMCALRRERHPAYVAKYG